MNRSFARIVLVATFACLAAAALAKHYRPQAEAYAISLSAVTDRPVKEVVLLFMRGPKEEPIPVDADPESVERGLSALLSDRQ